MDLAQIIAYYVNLLIIQYSGLPNASATIALIAETIMSDNIVAEIEAAYNIVPALGATAIGPQLDVIGKYVGVNRLFSAIDYGDYFALVPYSEADALPSSPPAFGFTTYATFNSEPSYNGTLYYGELVTSQNKLSDADFLTMIQLAILRNNMNFSDNAIDTALWSLFEATIRPEEGQSTMTMFYFCSGVLTPLLNAIIQKKVLPKPMGVSLGIITGISGLTFSLVGYVNQSSPYGYGLSTYANYESLNGTDLTYSMIQDQ